MSQIHQEQRGIFYILYIYIFFFTFFFMTRTFGFQWNSLWRAEHFLFHCRKICKGAGLWLLLESFLKKIIKSFTALGRSGLESITGWYRAAQIATGRKWSRKKEKKWKPTKKSRCQLEFLQAAARSEHKKL